MAKRQFQLNNINRYKRTLGLLCEKKTVHDYQLCVYAMRGTMDRVKEVRFRIPHVFIILCVIISTDLL